MLEETIFCGQLCNNITIKVQLIVDGHNMKAQVISDFNNNIKKLNIGHTIDLTNTLHKNIVYSILSILR